MEPTIEKSLKEHEKFLTNNLFLKGNEPSSDDADLFEALLKYNYMPSQDKYPSLWSWYTLINNFEDEVIKEWKKNSVTDKKGKKGQKNERKKSKNENKENEPLIGYEVVEESEEEMNKYKEIIKQQMDKHKDEKSHVFLGIKVVDVEQNIEELAKKIKIEVKRDGLIWFDKHETQECGFGIKKLIMGMLVSINTSVQDVIDQLETWEEEIQSVDFEAFNQA